MLHKLFGVLRHFIHVSHQLFACKIKLREMYMQFAHKLVYIYTQCAF